MNKKFYEAPVMEAIEMQTNMSLLSGSEIFESGDSSFGKDDADGY